jgi:uncharacterized protein YbjQ (UPF0145 family)
MAPKRVPGPLPKPSAKTPEQIRNEALGKSANVAQAAANIRNLALGKATVSQVVPKTTNQSNVLKETKIVPEDTVTTTAGISPDIQIILDQQAAEIAELKAQRSAASTAATAEKRQSAYDFIRTRAEELGIGVGIADRIIDLVANQGYSTRAIDIEIQTTPEYKARFAGIEKYKKNFAADIAVGKKAAQPSPADYIAYEKQAQNVLNRFGLASLANQETYADLIGGDVSILEVTERITDVYDRIQNADDVLKTQLSSYFPTYGTSDFARALLTGKTPQDMASQLKRRLTAAEISSEASRAGLATNAERAEQLQSMGVSRTLARAGFSKIAEQQPLLEKLGGIYGEQVSQEELEAEQFQGLASARRKRLEATERASFTGRAGTSQVSLTQGTAGAI